MKLAADFRRIARESMRGRWAICVAAALIAVMLGGITSSVDFNIDFGYDVGEYDVTHFMNIKYAGVKLLSVEGDFAKILNVYSVIFLLLAAVAFFVLGSIIEMGYCRFNLDLVDKEEVSIGTLFSCFSEWRTTAAARFLQYFYIFLWSLLFLIPGLIASFNYAMVGFVMADHPEMLASEVLSYSKDIMYGNRMRLFWLYLSFIGWHILSILSFGIGYIWVTPYIQASLAAFYREITFEGVDASEGIEAVEQLTSETENL